MPIGPDDLLDPVGDLDPKVLWPRQSSTRTTAKLTGYLDSAYALPAVAALDAALRDTPARQWAYYRAYGAVYQQMVRRPASIDVTNRGSTSILSAQIEMMKELRDQALAAFTDAVVAVPVVVALAPRESYSATVQFRP